MTQTNNEQQTIVVTEDANGLAIGSQIMSDIVFYRTYANTLSNGHKETYQETVERVENMHIQKFPSHFYEIHQAFKKVSEKKVVPSMRSMQYGGTPIKNANTRMFNCAFTNITCFQDFADILYLLCCGVGCGYSVQRRHVSQLPVIKAGQEESYAIPDTKEGWAESVILLLKNPSLTLDYSLVRPRGAPLSSGGTASGPETLQIMHNNIRSILVGAIGRQLRPLEVHDILCMIGDLIVSGGCRRSALISLFDHDEQEMMECKKGWDWFQSHPYRARSNNSAVLVRSDPNFKQNLEKVVRMCLENQTGEPGVFLTNDPDYGTNPCAEISLRSKQMCNLTEVNASVCQTKEEFLEAVKAATIIGTLQASYTNFSFIQPEWKANCDEDALLGVSLTGISQNWSLLSSENGQLLEEAAKLAKETNIEWAAKLGIKPAARVCTVKPSGTTSALLATTSGIHAAHAPYYLRRVRMETDSPLSTYFLSLIHNKQVLPSDTLKEIADTADATEQVLGLPVLETDVYARRTAEKSGDGATNVVITMPIKMKGAIVRDEESAVEILNRAGLIHRHYIQPAHTSGPNFHNVSLTVNYKPGEEEGILKWMLENTDIYSGISLFPDMSGGTVYPQLPFEDIDEETYKKWVAVWEKVGELAEKTVQVEQKEGEKDVRVRDTAAAVRAGMTRIAWNPNAIDTRKEILACAGGNCEYV
ncbi:putative Adenosylcobalamin-dependent ribonucleoside-triphosphate reductase [Blattamonas nauphoetae]|uniref:Adenosylcobalamin-dependent ribonucleoside-triphosphate reductase n=1 Tax=Blattamonas nauphoetae TaxID=2049346 RepID=A0ABQ9XG31_9EUKA|nr:putative Adenosylcobalamin-dependent ribonucleoside-triphosphate reductase [Blattamonas nauphoetae]